MVRVTLPGGEVLEVTEEEAAKGYSRTQDYTRKTQAHAAEVKAFEQERQQVRALTQHYAEMLPQLEAAITALMPQEPDWKLVAPEELPAKLADWRATQQRLATIQAEKQRLALEAQTAEQQEVQAILARERQALHAALPELADADKGKALTAKMVDYATAQGWTPEQIATVPDHRLFVLLHKAMLYDQQQQQAPKIQNKIERALATPKPGANAPKPKPDKLGEAKTRLERSGRTEDAAHAIAQLLD